MHGKFVCAFLDLCKFLDHSVLLHLLNGLGVLGNELKWFTNYLSYHLQRVKLNSKVSSWTSVCTSYILQYIAKSINYFYAL